MSGAQRQLAGASALTAWQPRVVEIVGRFVAASNATLLGKLGDETLVVYKPAAGERPLWDFPAESLAWREVLTYEVSEAMGLGVVPETAMGDGPFGPGAVQRFIEIDESADPVPLINRADPELWPVATLDIVCNNADRKVGHLMWSTEGKLYGVDHGLNFHVNDKLRTVLWSFAGETLPAECLVAVNGLLDALDGALGDRLAEALDEPTLHALRRRCHDLLGAGVHPHPPEDRPAIPWPPY